MRYEIKEKHELPLTFKFVDEYRSRKSDRKVSDVPYGKCKKYQTDFLMLVKPNKPLVRLL
jgi:hypothetical protein